MQVNLLVSGMKCFVFILLAIFSTSVFAEYYLVYSAPDCLEYTSHVVKKKIKKKVKKHHIRHKKVSHHVTKHYKAKNCYRTRSYVVYYSQPEIYGETYYREEIVETCK